MRRKLTKSRIRKLMKELARSAPPRGSYRVLFVGGATAVVEGWRDSTIDVDLWSDTEKIFRDVQQVKERLQMNIEFARPDDFVPSLGRSQERHVFIEAIGKVSFYHYDPYAQFLAKVVRGFERDVVDARAFLDTGMVDAKRFRQLVESIPATAYSRYPTLSRDAVRDAVEEFLSREQK